VTKILKVKLSLVKVRYLSHLNRSLKYVFFINSILKVVIVRNLYKKYLFELLYPLLMIKTIKNKFYKILQDFLN